MAHNGWWQNGARWHNDAQWSMAQWCPTKAQLRTMAESAMAHNGRCKMHPVLAWCTRCRSWQKTAWCAVMVLRSGLVCHDVGKLKKLSKTIKCGEISKLRTIKTIKSRVLYTQRVCIIKICVLTSEYQALLDIWMLKRAGRAWHSIWIWIFISIYCIFSLVRFGHLHTRQKNLKFYFCS